MEVTQSIASNFVERSIVGMTMAVGILWKDLFMEYFGKTAANMFALVVIATLFMATMLAYLPEEFDPR